MTLLQRARQAQQLYQEWLQATPDDFSGWLELGNVLRRQAQLREAAQTYDRAVACQPQRFEAHLSLARVLEQLAQ